MSDGLQYSINFTGNAVQVLQHVNEQLGNTMNTAKKAGGVFGDCWKSLLAGNQIVQSLDTLKNSLTEINVPGIALNKNMQDLSAITGVTGKGLDAISDAARASAKVFGTDAAENVESYKIILSKLDPKIAESTQAMKVMGDNVNILSKSMGGDTVASAGVLTTAMNQFGVSTKNPIEASKTMAEMMNIMAAASQAGSAELPEIGRALENVGMIAKTTGVSFAETNAAIQVLDKAGAKGAEGGVALRNIITSMAAPSAAAIKALNAYGISTAKLADPNISLSEKLKLLKPAMGDVNAMAKIFEKANIGSAIAMIKNTDALDDYTKGITGTTSAQDQAKIVMDSYEERMKRQKAKLDDMKIGFFNATESMQPYIMGTLGVMTELGKLGSGFSAISSLVNNDFTKSIGASIKNAGGLGAAMQQTSGKVMGFIRTMALSTVAVLKQGLQMGISAAITVGGFISSIVAATAAQVGLNIAMSANPIGLLVIGIAAAIAAVVLLIKYWDEIWTVIKSFAKWVWENNPFRFLIEVIDKIFPGFKAAMGELWDWIAKKFTALIDWFKNAFASIKEFFGFGGDASVTGTITTEQQAKDTQAMLDKADKSITPIAPITPIGKAIGKNTRENSKADKAAASSSTGAGTSAGHNIKSLTITKLVENLIIHTTNLGDTKEKIRQAVTETLLTSVNDFNLSGS